MISIHRSPSVEYSLDQRKLVSLISEKTIRYLQKGDSPSTHTPSSVRRELWGEPP